MAAQVACGSFVWDSGTSNKAITVGFAVKAVLLISPMVTAPETPRNERATYSYGFAYDGSGSISNRQQSLGWISGRNTGADLHVASVREVGSFVWANVNENGLVLESASAESLDADGFTIDPVIQLADGRYFFIAFGGDDVQAHGGSVSRNTTIGEQAVTGVGFEPDLVFVWAPQVDTAPSLGNDAALSFGWADASMRQGVAAHQCQSDVTPSVVNRYQSPSACAAVLNPDTGALEAVGVMESFDADGFTIDWTTAYSTAGGIYYLAIKGVNAHAGALTQPSSTGEQSTTGLDVSPSVVMFQSYGAASGSSVASDLRYSIGAGSVDANAGLWSCDEDGVAADDDRRNMTTYHDDAAIVLASPASESTVTVQAEAAITAVNDAGRFTLDWTSTDSDGRELLYLALGGPAVPEYIGSFVRGVKTRVTASRAASFGLDGNENTHSESGVLKVFGAIDSTEDISAVGEGNLIAEAAALGEDAVAGKQVRAQRNTSGNGAAGTLVLQERDGTDRYLWFEDNKLYKGTAAPTEDNSTVSHTGTEIGGAGGSSIAPPARWTIDGAGSAITTGTKSGAVWTAPADGAFTRAVLNADQAGSIVIDVWKDTFANYPPTNADSITASAPPTLSAAAASEDTTLSGWTTSFSQGDQFIINVDSVSTVTRVTLTLEWEPS